MASLVRQIREVVGKVPSAPKKCPTSFCESLASEWHGKSTSNGKVWRVIGTPEAVKPSSLKESARQSGVTLLSVVTDAGHTTAYFTTPENL